MSSYVVVTDLAIPQITSIRYFADPNDASEQLAAEMSPRPENTRIGHIDALPWKSQKGKLLR